jgi:putative transcriptional regulator
MVETIRPEIDMLTGSFLISTPNMPDPRFAKQVIYICSHGHDGAIGIAINKPNPQLKLEEVLLSNHLPVPERLNSVIHMGGPVEPQSAFILYSSDYVADEQLEVSSSVYMSRHTGVLEDIAHGRGPKKFLFAIGYAGWGPGQLEQELLSQGWLTIPASDSIIFDVPDEEKWNSAAAVYGIDIETYSDVIGNA